MSCDATPRTLELELVHAKDHNVIYQITLHYITLHYITLHCITQLELEHAKDHNTKRLLANILAGKVRRRR